MRVALSSFLISFSLCSPNFLSNELIKVKEEERELDTQEFKS